MDNSDIYQIGWLIKKAKKELAKHSIYMAEMNADQALRMSINGNHFVHQAYANMILGKIKYLQSNFHKGSNTVEKTTELLHQAINYCLKSNDIWSNCYSGYLRSTQSLEIENCFLIIKAAATGGKTFDWVYKDTLDSLLKAPKKIRIRLRLFIINRGRIGIAFDDWVCRKIFRFFLIFSSPI